MSVRMVVACNGRWPGRACVKSFSAGVVEKAKARELAKANGWSQDRNADYCPACTLKRSRGYHL